VIPSTSPKPPLEITSAVACNLPVYIKFAIMLNSSSAVPVPLIKTSICSFGKSLTILTAY
jgi:hypothetical protein